MRRLLQVLTVIWIAGLWAAPAAAQDIAGTRGIPLSLQINTAPSDVYLQYHGRLFVRNEANAVDEYRWGGTSCGSRVLTEPQMAALQGAINNKLIRISPLYQDGQGMTRCLVSFQLTPKPYLKFLP